MVKPASLIPKPSIELSVLGGLVAALLFSALLYLTPVAGLPFMDIPHLLGGIFTANAEVALWLGFWIYFLTGVFILPPLLRFFWDSLPGDAVSFGGAFLKGTLSGLLLWLVAGAILPLLGLVNRLSASERLIAEAMNPGFFALDLGIPAAVAFLLIHLLYGIALALVANMGQDISPIDTIGWTGYTHAETYEVLQLHRRGSHEQ